jgi:hydrophobic/amphiphilic exporter-1 (mainly G- bacteria), HAE1 family
MSRFAIRTPYFIVVVALIIIVIGVTSVVRMPVDMFPNIDIAVVAVATFYSGMPPEQIETDITARFERFFTLGSGIDHMESRSLPGVSVIRVYFQPGFNSDAAVSEISNLAMANLRRLPPGTLPPIVLKFDASSLPVCLITFKGEGLNETQLKDAAWYQVRTQVASVSGASVPQPFGGITRQIMVYVDPYKLESHQMSVMDVVRAVNESNLILPAGDVKIGNFDYNIYTNSQAPDLSTISNIPLRTVGQATIKVGDVAKAVDGGQIQTNIVRVDGQPSVFVQVLKQGGDTNTIEIVNGVREKLKHLVDVPKQLVTDVVFDQSKYVKSAIETLIHEGGIGLFLTSLMILIFLGSFRATIAVFFSIPISALATFIALFFGGSSINSMVLGGLALAFSRLIDNSVVVLENIYRHLEMGETPEEAAERGGREVALPVLAATLTTLIVFFPVTFLFGVSKFLFQALALAVILSLLASYVVAMTVVPLFCSRFIKTAHTTGAFNKWFDHQFEALLNGYDKMIARVLRRPGLAIIGLAVLFVVSLAIFPNLGLSFFPRTDAGQFVVNLKAPTGTRIEVTNQLIEQVEQLIRKTIPPDELKIIVSNIGATPDISALYTTNSAPHTSTVQVNLSEGHKVGSYEYMDRVRQKLAREMPQLTAYFQSGGLVDAVLNLGLPAPIDIQVAGSNMEGGYKLAADLARQIRHVPNVSDVYIPQDLDYPSLHLDVNRERASELGFDLHEVVNNVITALTSNAMIAPSYWIDPKTGQDYMLTVQYPETQIQSMPDLKAIPLRSPDGARSTRLDMVSRVTRFLSPTEVDHYQLRRITDIYVQTKGEDLGRVANAIDKIIDRTKAPAGIDVSLRGMVQNMRASFKSFGLGLCMSVVLLFLVITAQFQSFVDPVLILLALPPGLTGVLLTLWLTGTTLNVMSLMGIIMMVGISVSDSILIVEFTKRLRADGMAIRQAVATAARVRLRPVLMTSLATVIGLLPMALKFGEGSEAYAPLARAICGGVTVSAMLTVFVVPAAYVFVYGRKEAK